MTVCLKACKRCGGDMSYENDIYGQFIQCLQCSYVEDFPDEATFRAGDKHEQALEPVDPAVHKETMVKEASGAV
jgi:hypothetical protein